MTSKVQIANIALTHLGVGVIQNFDEPNERARKVTIMYPIALRSVLRDHDWGFARKNLILALRSEVITGWDYTYSYPTDCVIARKILDPTGSFTGTSLDFDTGFNKQVGKVEFDIVSNAAGTNRLIVTNKADAELQYTKFVTDTNMYDDLFIELFGLKLAANLAIPLTGKAPFLSEFNKEYKNLLITGKAVNANEGYKQPDNVNVFANSRN